MTAPDQPSVEVSEEAETALAEEFWRLNRRFNPSLPSWDEVEVDVRGRTRVHARDFIRRLLAPAIAAKAVEAEREIAQLRWERDDREHHRGQETARAEEEVDRARRVEAQRDQAIQKERERVEGMAALLQQWARTKRREAKDVSGDTETIKLEWVAKGYDNAADLILAALQEDDRG